MKTPKPGQFCVIDNVYYRARKRVNGCYGCALNNVVLCPNVIDSRNGVPRLECAINNIILQRIPSK